MQVVSKVGSLHSEKEDIMSRMNEGASDKPIDGALHADTSLALEPLTGGLADSASGTGELPDADLHELAGGRGGAAPQRNEPPPKAHVGPQGISGAQDAGIVSAD